MSIYTPLLKCNPKAKPLARTLITAAAKQGVNAEELKLACEIAQESYRRAMEQSAIPLSEFQSEAEAALDSI